jgi:thiol:disulfide interchange protein
MRYFRFLAWALLFALAASVPAAAQIDNLPKVHARLIAETSEVAPGATVVVALEQDIRSGWHTYWQNPGDAGAATEIAWTLPPGWHAGEIAWPYPKELPVGPLMDYGYEGKPWLLVNLTAPSDAKPGQTVMLKAAVNWLVCKEVCIPEDTTLSLPLTISATPAAAYATIAAQFAAAHAKLPVSSPWPARFHLGDTLDLYLQAPQLAAVKFTSFHFFPFEQDVLKGIAPQKLGLAGEGIVVRLARGKQMARRLGGVLVLTSTDGSVQAITLDAPPGSVPQVSFDTEETLSLPLALLFAVLGGLILNLMPCVLPILAMKALAVASKAGRAPHEAAQEGLSYGAGAVLSFVALGGSVVLLRASGEAIGWGFQLQEPAAVAGFALLIFAVGLNLSGVFEFGGVTAGDALTRKGGIWGAFFTGVLAVAVAAPCTAPFMAAALGFALAQNTATALGVFLALGVGFAAPFVAIGLVPGLSRLLPKPGAWMLAFKQALAFPMYGAAAWLVWVLAQEAGPQGVIAILAGMVVLAFAAWAWGASRNANARWRIAGAVFAIAGALAALFSLTLVGSQPGTAAQTAATGSIPSQPYSDAKLGELRAQQRPVFVDATAAWCITCLVNEKVAFDNARVQQIFAAKHIAFLVADWTNRNPAITALLQAHGRSGVPLYLYYAPGASEAKVLPQILTEDEVADAIGAP